MKIFNLPDLGEGLPDAEVNQWHVKEGDVVKADALLVSMETAKAVVDVPSPYSGTIVKLHGKPGDIIQTGSPLIEFTEEGEAIVEASESSPTPTATKTETPKAKEATGSKTVGSVAGTIEVGDTVIKESATGISPTAASSAQGIKAIPAVRALAKKLGVNLKTITPTGTQGRITPDDVKKAAVVNDQVEAAITLAPGGQVEPLRGVRRTMTNVMIQSHSEVVPVTLVDDADIHAWPEKTDITWRVIRALVAACHTEPALNAHFNLEKLERTLFGEINIGIAMDSKDGLFVPVIKNAEKMAQPEVRKTINRFKKQVGNRSLPQDDFKGSTIQLSNFGTFAGRYANPILVPPIVAILGTGKIREEVVAVKNAIAIHRVIPLSLTIDHRGVTGGEAARFLKAIIDDLEKAE